MRLALLLLILFAVPSWAEKPLRIAVAANFKPTLENISRQFQANTGIEVALSSASTGVLATQIEHGAPSDLFFVADREAPLKIMAKQKSQHGNAFCYALGCLTCGRSRQFVRTGTTGLQRSDCAICDISRTKQ